MRERGNLRISDAKEKPANNTVIANKMTDDHFKRGNDLFNNEKYGEAAEEYKLAIVAKPNDSVSHTFLGDCYLFLEQYPAALREYNSALQINPNDARTYYGLGAVNHDLSDYRKAVSYYQQALEIDPNHLQAKEMLKEAQDKLVGK